MKLTVHYFDDEIDSIPNLWRAERISPPESRSTADDGGPGPTAEGSA